MAANGIPRVGVYVCDCGTNIAATVDVKSVVEFASGLPGVVVAREYKYVCSEPGQQLIQQDIKRAEAGAGRRRLLLAQDARDDLPGAVAKAGLNPFYFAMVNIREHVSWVVKDKEQATAKARRIVRAAVSRALLQEELVLPHGAGNSAALVVGGGIAGIQSAFTIADAGYKVYLVERQPSIGGHMAQLDKTFPTLDCST